MVFHTAASALLCALISAVFRTSLPPPQLRSASEQDVKAAFLYNFTRFVSWPAGIPPGSEPFRICVVADRQTTEAIERTMAGEMANGRAVETRSPRTPDETRSCQVLFVGREAESSASPLLAAAQESPVLIVGEGDGFAERGGAIGFVVEGGRVRFDISSRNAQRSGLTISSRLLTVARRTDAGRSER